MADREPRKGVWFGWNVQEAEGGVTMAQLLEIQFEFQKRGWPAPLLMPVAIEEVEKQQIPHWNSTS
jgi:hypothetical protein